MRKKLLRSRSGFEKPESREEAIMQNILGASNVLDPSESNIEEILKSILYNTPYTKEAEFEIEKILLAIKNNGTYDGEGESRDLKILIAILNDLDYTEGTESRIEELFVEWLHQRSSIMVLEGVPPLTFVAKGNPLINYEISGNTTQSGTPTPDSPVMPEGTGDRTENIVAAEAKHTTSIGGLLALWEKDSSEMIINGKVTADSSSRFATIELAPGTYTLSITGLDETGLNKTGFYLSGVDTARVQGVRTYTITEPTTARLQFVAIISDVSYENRKVTIMLTKTSTPLPYEPYGYKIPISSAGQTTPVYLGEVESTRKIKKLVFDGTEAWRLYTLTGATNVERFYLVVSKNAVSAGSIISSHFPTLTDNSDIEHTRCGGSPIKEVYIYISRTVATTVADLKSYLAAQYAAGTPVTVWYVLATSTTGIVNEPLMKIGTYTDTISYAQAGIEIPTENGSNTLDIDTTVKPSNIYIEYK